VNRAISRLASLEANVLGFVFNRAYRTDFVRSFQASSSYRPSEEGAAEPRYPLPRRGVPDSTFGVLVDAVLESLPTRLAPA
jgi:hypothetical protein